MPSEHVDLRGHIIDSLTLPKVLDEIMNHGGSFVIQEMKIGQRPEDPSHARIEVSAPSESELAVILQRIRQQGAMPTGIEEVRLETADMDGAFPDGFYCTTHLNTAVRIGGRWIDVERPEMDCGIFVDPAAGRAWTLPMNCARKGERVVVGQQGIKVQALERSRRRNVFEFMSSSVSSEKPKGVVIREVANQIRATKDGKGKVLVVAGPAVVHTGAGYHLQRIIEARYVDLLFAGNALALHDIEQALYGTSLGVHLDRGMPAVEGHEHHLRAVNTIRRLGGIRKAVENGVLKNGIMRACVRHGIPYVLGGSIRDDGPLPEVITDVMEAQAAMRAAVPGVEICLMLASALHGIAVGNLLPAAVKLICVDINPAVVTKLTDRGSFQAIGLVTDTEPFLRELSRHLCPPS